MRALVVYESSFGNTEAVARAIADGLGLAADVELVEACDAPGRLPRDLDLLVAGAPTHTFGLSRLRTREKALRRGAVHPIVTGLREWLGALELGRSPTLMATFDTRLRRRLPGSAARAAHRRLRLLGMRSLHRPMSFFVAGTPGPLLRGELARAKAWGEHLCAHLGLALAEKTGRRRTEPSRRSAVSRRLHRRLRAARITPQAGRQVELAQLGRVAPEAGSLIIGAGIQRRSSDARSRRTGLAALPAEAVEVGRR
jgi:hypothetical protein